MARKICVIFLLLIIANRSSFCQSLNVARIFTITGSTNNYNKECIYLEYIDSSYKFVLDSAKVENGKFVFTGYIKEPSLAFIKSDKSINSPEAAEFDDFFLEASNIHIVVKGGDFRNSVYSGSSCDSIYRTNKLMKRPLQKQLQELENKFNNEKNQEAKIALETQYLLQLNSINKEDIKFIDRNRQSYTSMYLLQFVCDNLSYAEFKRIYANFSLELRISKLGKSIKDLLEKVEKLDVGKAAPNFSQVDLSKKQISLSDFKGKYVILDFWASWCGPCRRTFKSLKQRYHAYKDQGLQIILISSDDNESEWRKAIVADSLSLWHNIIDSPKTNPINNFYQINLLPTKYLIDTSGHLVGRYNAWEEKELYHKLEEIFKR